MSMKKYSTSKETRHIATSTDANYLHKALVMYRSLLKVHKNFVLHIFCFDYITYDIFNKFGYKNVKLYKPSDFETPELLEIRRAKKRQYEYYWTCNPHITRKLLIDQDVEFTSSCDCDLYFYQSPEMIFDELEGADILIQPNNFSYQFESDFVTVGYYCTSFQTFRKNSNSRKILNWWHDRTIEWCSSKFEDGKFGEQKYLDDWRIRFKRVREIANIGTNVAPWSIQKYDISKVGKEIMINNKFPLVYYHFHSLRMDLKNYKYILTGDRNNSYPLQKEVVDLIYKPYLKELKKAIQDLKKIKEYRDYVVINPEGKQIDYEREKQSK